MNDTMTPVRLTIHAVVDSEENREAVQGWMLDAAIRTSGVENPRFVVLPSATTEDDTPLVDVMLDVDCLSPSGANITEIPIFRLLERELLHPGPPAFVREWRAVLYR